MSDEAVQISQVKPPAENPPANPPPENPPPAAPAAQPPPVPPAQPPPEAQPRPQPEQERIVVVAPEEPHIWTPIFILLYLITAICVASWVTVFAWPGSSLARNDNLRLRVAVMREVTLRSMEKLDATLPLILQPGGTAKEAEIAQVRDANILIIALTKQLQDVVVLGAPPTSPPSPESQLPANPATPSPANNGTPLLANSAPPSPANAGTPPSEALEKARRGIAAAKQRLSSRLAVLEGAEEVWSLKVVPLAGWEISEFEKLFAERFKAGGASLFGSSEIARLILLAALGAIGASIQGISSVATYLGKRLFLPRWTVFYLSRPWVGAGLAVTFFVTLSAGVGDSPKSFDASTPWTIAALALLVGLFSGEAMEKLRVVAGAFFQPSDKHDSAFNNRPSIAAATATLADQKINLVVDGSQFDAQCQLLVEKTTIKTLLVSATQLRGSFSLTDEAFASLKAAKDKGDLKFNVIVFQGGAAPHVTGAILVKVS